MALSDYQRRVLDDGASAYWPLDDPSGTVARDLVGTPTEIPCDLGKAYLQARSGIARSCASRSNYVWPLFGVITVGGFNITPHVQYGTLRITQALNEQPDTASFDVLLTDANVQANCTVGVDVLIGLGGPTENTLFGGRILTTQTRRGPARTPSIRSVLCADYLQVLDSEQLITYDWPPQSATITILDLIARFANKPSGVTIATAGIEPALPSHASFAVANERFSTVLRRLVTMFPAGGGFYVDPLKVLHVWAGVAEPSAFHPRPVTLENAMVKAFAETVDGSQQRNAVLVEGVRTNAPLGTPGPNPTDATGRHLYSIPVLDASIINPDPAGSGHEVRIGTQRVVFRRANGTWNAPIGTPMTTTVTADVAFDPNPALENNTVTIPIAEGALLTGRETGAWVRIDEQYLYVVSIVLTPAPYLIVPRTWYGAMLGPIKAGAVVTAIDSLADGYVTTRYDAPGQPEQIRAQPIDADVVMTVRSALDNNAVLEQLVQDGRFSHTTATNRGTQEIQDFAQALISIDYETDDLNARPGRLQAYTLAEPPITPMVGEYMILSTEIYWPVWGQPPRRQCQAAKVRAANVVDAWLVDPR